MSRALPPVYPELNASGDRTQVYVSLSKSDRDILVSIFADQTIISHVSQLFIRACATYARSHNLSFADRDRFYLYLRQRSSGTADNEAGAQDVTGRVEGARESTASPTHVPTGTGKNAPSGRRGGKGKGGKR